MRYLIITILILLYSCGSDHSGGTVSEAGNAKISCIVVDSLDSAQSGVIVFLVPEEFDPISGDKQNLLFSLSDNNGRATFETTVGRYNIWAQSQDKILFNRGIILEKDDSLHLPNQKLRPSATIAIKREPSIETLFTKGVPFPFTTDTTSNYIIGKDIPTGKLPIYIQKTNEIQEQETTLYPNDTTFLNDSYSWRHWYLDAILNSIYSLYSSGDSLFVGAGSALGIYNSESWEHLTSSTSGLPSNWILGMAPFENKLYIATDKGAATFDGSTVTPFSDIDTLKMFRFHKTAGKLWYSTGAEVGAIQNSAVTERYSNTTIGTANTLLSVHAGTDTLWVGTQYDGLYLKAGDTWFKDTSFSDQWSQIEVYFIDTFEDKLWLSTTNMGIFCRENNQWRHYSVASGNLPSERIYATYVDTVENQILFGTMEGQLISYSEGIFTTMDDFTEAISGTGIFAIHKDEQKLWLGTYGQGLVVLE